VCKVNPGLTAEKAGDLLRSIKADSFEETLNAI
jgi:hypothetical protein